MTAQGRWLGLAVVTLVLAMAMTAWQIVRTAQSEREVLLSARAEADVQQLRLQVELSVERTAQKLIQLVGQEIAQRAGLASSVSEDFAASDFSIMALMTPVEGAGWSPAWTREREGVTSRWPAGQVAALLQQLPLARSETGEVVWFRAQDPQQLPLFFVAVPVVQPKDAVAVAALSAPAFSELMKGWKTQNAEAVVFDERGFALAYVEQRYVGAQVDALPVVAEILKTREPLLNFVGKNREGDPVIAAGARVPGANLYVAVAHPVASPLAWLPRLTVTMLILWVVFALLFGGLVWFFLKPTQEALTYLKEQIQAVARGRPVAYLPEGNAVVAELRGDVERLISDERHPTPEYIREATEVQVDQGKLGAYKELGLGLSQALRDPLATILGQAQLARSKASDETLKSHFVVIEREARRARDTLENVLRLTGEERFPRSRVNLQDVVLASLAALKNSLSAHNIKVQKDLSESAMVQVHAGQLQTALEEIFKNAIEAMVGASERQLKVATNVDETEARIVIEDSGSGLTEAELGRVFEPFFTTKTAGDHNGLGLTVAKGIIKGFGGSIRLEAKPGQGAICRIALPTLTAMRMVKPADAVVADTPEIGVPKKEVGIDLKHVPPLTGTATDHLPATPALDEVTLIGVRPEHESVLSAAELPSGLNLPRTNKGEPPS